MRVFTVRMAPTAVTVAKTLIRVSAPATTALVILRAWITQETKVTSEQLRALIQRASTTGTGTATTPEKHEVGDAAFAGSAAVNLTAEPTLTGNPFNNEDFNILNGFIYVPMPEERVIVPPSGIIVLRSDIAPAASMTMTAGMTFGSLG